MTLYDTRRHAGDNAAAKHAGRARVAKDVRADSGEVASVHATDQPAPPRPPGTTTGRTLGRRWQAKIPSVRTMCRKLYYVHKHARAHTHARTRFENRKRSREKKI